MSRQKPHAADRPSGTVGINHKEKVYILHIVFTQIIDYTIDTYWSLSIIPFISYCFVWSVAIAPIFKELPHIKLTYFGMCTTYNCEYIHMPQWNTLPQTWGNWNHTQKKYKSLLKHPVKSKETEFSRTQSLWNLFCSKRGDFCHNTFRLVRNNNNKKKV